MSSPPPDAEEVDTRSVAGGGVDGFCDRGDDGVRVGQHGVVPESKHAISLKLEPGRPSRIILDGFRVLSPVKLDDQSLRQTDEINNVASNDELAAKWPAHELAVMKPRPEPTFGIGHLLSQATCPVS